MQRRLCFYFLIYPGFAAAFLLALFVIPDRLNAQEGQRDSSISADEATIIRGDLIKLRRHILRELDRIDQRLRALESGNRKPPQGPTPSQKQTVPVTPVQPPAVVEQKPEQTPPAAPDTSDGKKALVCDKGCRYPNLYEAVKAARPGDTITVAPGLYGMCANISKPLSLVGLRGDGGKRAHLGGGVCAGKGPLVAAAPEIHIEGFEISNVTVRDKNGACIRIDPKVEKITIKDIYCHDSENGILGHLNNGDVRVEDSVFERNGSNNGRSHGIYIAKANVLEVFNTVIMSSKLGGHTLKSGARKTIVENSVLAALDGRNSRGVDLFGGGELIIRNSVIEQSVNTDNHEAFGIALEPKRLNPEPHSVLIENNWIIFDDLNRCCRFLFAAKLFGGFTVRDNQIVGMTDVGLPSFESEIKKQNKFYPDRKAAGLPPYDGTLMSLPKVPAK